MKPESQTLLTGKFDNTCFMPPMWSEWGWVATKRSIFLIPSFFSSFTSFFPASSGPASISIVSPSGSTNREESPCPTSKVNRYSLPFSSGVAGLPIQDAAAGKVKIKRKRRINIFLYFFRVEQQFKMSLLTHHFASFL